MKRLQKGELWQRVVEQSADGLKSGALHSLPTDCEFIEQGGIRFAVRILANLERKDQAKRQQQLKPKGADFDPFLPYEEDLFVADLGETHVCLLNKYNVFNHHLLIVTRAFEAQTELLNEQDFAALASCMVEFEGFAFYNGGTLAGASQRHKHLQYVPLPLSPSGAAIPLQPLLKAGLAATKDFTAPLPFDHAIAVLSPAIDESTTNAAQTLTAAYRRLLATFHLAENGTQQSAPYNLLATRQWMMVVPRLQESYANISVNALGFAGSLFVRNQEELQLLRDVGPMRILEHVAKHASV